MPGEPTRVFLVNDRSASSSVPPPRGSGRLTDDWGDKAAETIRRKRPLYRRTWFRRSLLGLFVAGGLAGAVGLGKLDTWHAGQRAAFEAEWLQVADFVASDEFAAFARAADAQIVAALNFVVARPKAAAAVAPAAAAWERAHHELSWTLLLSPLPVSAAREPGRIFAAGRTAATLLARHSFAWDERIRESGRALMLRLLAPYARDFVKKSPEYALRELWRDRRLQEQVLTAFGRRSGSLTPRADAERLFAFYALVGPDMWDEIDGAKLSATTAGAGF